MQQIFVDHSNEHQTRPDTAPTTADAGCSWRMRPFIELRIWHGSVASSNPGPACIAMRVYLADYHANIPSLSAG